MELPPLDFESSASTSFTTPAAIFTSCCFNRKRRDASLFDFMRLIWPLYTIFSQQKQQKYMRAGYTSRFPS